MVKKRRPQSFILADVFRAARAYGSNPPKNPSEAVKERHFIEEGLSRMGEDMKRLEGPTKLAYKHAEKGIRTDYERGNQVIDTRMGKSYEIDAKKAYQNRADLTPREQEKAIEKLRLAEAYFKRAGRDGSEKRVKEKIFNIKRAGIGQRWRGTRAAAGIIGMASLALSLFFFSEGITGNVIGSSSTTPNMIGIILFVIGLVGVYFSVKR